MMKSVTVFDMTWMLAPGPQPTTALEAMFWPGEKLMFDVPGNGPLGHTEAKPPAWGPAIVRLINTALAVVGTPLLFCLVSTVTALFDAVGAFGPTAVGVSPGSGRRSGQGGQSSATAATEIEAKPSANPFQPPERT